MKTATSKVCSFEGCGRKAVRRNLCNGHSIQLKKGQPLRALGLGRNFLRPLADRIVLATKKHPNGYIEWQGGRHRRGYGVIADSRGKRIQAHRASYDLFVGHIPEGMVVRHCCDNPSCVNPSHLSIGSQADNVADREARGRRIAPKGSQHGMSKLNEEAVTDILKNYRRGSKVVGLKAFAEKYDVDITMVSLIVRRKNWSHVACA